MSSDRQWELAYESGEFKLWESDFPSPELAALLAARMLPKTAMILDVGCGGGNDAIFMAQCGFSVIGVDITAEALKIAEKRAEKADVKVDWRKGSVLELPIEDGSIDFVTDRALFHHVVDADRAKYASELFRVLKVGGRALIRGASDESARGRLSAVSKKVVSKYFPAAKFDKGPILRIPLLSVGGATYGVIVMVQKISRS